MAELQAAGPDHPMMVYRPWTVQDMKEAMCHLPDPSDSGTRFADELLVFCQEFSPTMRELHRLLAVKMGAANWHKVSAEAGNGQECRESPNWENVANMAYTAAVKRLCDAILKMAFPPRCDPTKLSDCVQKRDESVQDYHARLYDVCKRYSGLEEPRNPGEAMSLWESNLIYYFLNGLRPEILTSVKSTCIIWRNERLNTVRAHAIHDDERDKKSGKSGQERFCRVYKKKGHRMRDCNRCRVCGKPGHWAKECTK